MSVGRLAGRGQGTRSSRQTSRHPGIPLSNEAIDPAFLYGEHGVFVEERELGQCVSECSWTAAEREGTEALGSIMSPFLSSEVDVPPHPREASEGQ